MTSTAPETQRGHDAGDPLGEQPTSWQRRLRRFGHVPRPETSLRDRLDPPYTRPGRQVWSVLAIPPHVADRLVRWSAWGGPLLVTLVAGLLRFWKLDQPHAVIFDETYYAKDAWALVNQGYEGSWPKDVDKQILNDPSSVPIPTDPGYVVHPPVGKWIIGLGEQLFGFTPFGWRFMVAVLGTISVLLLCRIGRRLFRSTFLGCLAGLLLAVDGLHFVMSRTALLDLIVMFFVLAAFGCLVVDRDHARRRLAGALPLDEEGVLRPDARVAETLRLGWRPWRLAAGVMLGLAFATKWNGLYVLAAFGLMTVLWDVGARRTAGAVHPYQAVLRRDLVPAFVSTVPVAIVTYVVSWTGWIFTDKGYYRNWAATEGRTPPGAGCSLTGCAALVALREPGVRLPRRPDLGPHVRVQPLELAGPGPPGLVLLRGADGLHGVGDRQVRRRGPGHRHPAPVVAGVLRPRVRGVALVLPPRLAGPARSPAAWWRAGCPGSSTRSGRSSSSTRWCSSRSSAWRSR